jgi:hypothetical protein
MKEIDMRFLSTKISITLLLGSGIAMGILLYAGIQMYYGHHVTPEYKFQSIIQMSEIISQMRIDLLKSVEMEKNAVMAITDEESRKFADQSSVASSAVENNLDLLRLFTRAASLQNEQKFVTEFSDCWEEFRRLDQAILELAVQNTNLKAASPSQEKGSEATERIESTLNNIMSTYSETLNDRQVTRLSYRAINACLKIKILHNSHIAEPSDENMNQLEAKIKKEENEAAICFAELATIVGGRHQNTLRQAQEAFTKYMQVTASVLQLSRQNSNIKSMELSLSKKRKTTAVCDEILAALQESVQKRSVQATR